jgi:hypothetical protein
MTPSNAADHRFSSSLFLIDSCSGVGAAARAGLWMRWSGASDRMLCAARTYEQELALANEAAAVGGGTS